MARKLRLQYPGAICPVMNRGDRREAVFLDDLDRQWFLESLCQACEKAGWQVHAYCLMGNPEADEQHATHIIADFLKESGMDRARLELLPASSTAKLDLARRLRRQTPMSLKRIARHLGMGSWKHLSNLLANEPIAPDQPELGL